MTDIQTHRRRYLIALLIVCPLAAYLSLPNRPDNGIETHAHRISRLAAEGSGTLDRASQYEWVSDREVAIRRYDGWPALLDIKTHTESPPTALMQALIRRPDMRRLWSHGLQDWVISPDGKYVLTYTFSRTLHRYWVVAALDGSRIFVIPSWWIPVLMLPSDHPDTRIFWDRDSQGFVQWDADDPLNVRRIRLGPEYLTTTTHLPPDKFAAMEAQPIPLMSRMGYGDLSPVDTIMSDRLLLCGVDADPPRIALRMFSLNGAPPIDLIERIPPRVQLDDVKLSPDCSRIAYLFESRWASRAGEPRPFGLFDRDRNALEIWVANLDGSNMHVLVGSNSHWPNPSIEDLSWTPDGRNITFTFGESLYTVPAS